MNTERKLTPHDKRMNRGLTFGDWLQGARNWASNNGIDITPITIAEAQEYYDDGWAYDEFVRLMRRRMKHGFERTQ